MRLSEYGVQRIQDLYWELGSLLESHMVQFDKIIMVGEGQSPEELELMIELLKNTVMEFEEEATRIYTEEYDNENDY